MIANNPLSSAFSSAREDFVEVEMFSTSCAANVDGGGPPLAGPAAISAMSDSTIFSRADLAMLHAASWVGLGVGGWKAIVNSRLMISLTRWGGGARRDIT